MQSLFFHDIWLTEPYYELIHSVNSEKMSHKTLGIIIIIFAVIVLYSDQEYAWIVSSISIGIGSGIFIWKENEKDIDN